MQFKILNQLRKTLEKENEEKDIEKKDSQEKNNDNNDYKIISDEEGQNILDNRYRWAK